MFKRGIREKSIRSFILALSNRRPPLKISKKKSSSKLNKVGRIPTVRVKGGKLITLKEGIYFYCINDNKKHLSYISEKDMEMDRRALEAVKAAKQKAMICKKPIAKYDAKSKKAYLEYADGSIKYVD